MTAADLDRAVIEQARQIAEEEIGGPPPRCTGPLADRYNAAFNAVVKAHSRWNGAEGQEAQS